MTERDGDRRAHTPEVRWQHAELHQLEKALRAAIAEADLVARTRDPTRMHTHGGG